MVAQEFKTIHKEAVEHLRFPSTEVLQDASLVEAREADLKRALQLGNLEHGKIKIYFEDEQLGYMVETTVWGVTDKRVILKQGVVIPIHRIHSVRL
jgi:hypothetical protein